jgi:hypothetical protein
VPRLTGRSLWRSLWSDRSSHQTEKNRKWNKGKKSIPIFWISFILDLIRNFRLNWLAIFVRWNNFNFLINRIPPNWYFQIYILNLFIFLCLNLFIFQIYFKFIVFSKFKFFIFSPNWIKSFKNHFVKSVIETADQICQKKQLVHGEMGANALLISAIHWLANRRSLSTAQHNVKRPPNSRALHKRWTRSLPLEREGVAHCIRLAAEKKIRLMAAEPLLHERQSILRPCSEVLGGSVNETDGRIVLPCSSDRHLESKSIFGEQNFLLSVFHFSNRPPTRNRSVTNRTQFFVRVFKSFNRMFTLNESIWIFVKFHF